MIDDDKHDDCSSNDGVAVDEIDNYDASLILMINVNECGDDYDDDNDYDDT